MIIYGCPLNIMAYLMFICILILKILRSIFLGFSIIKLRCCIYLLIIAGMAIKLCLYDESEHLPVHTEDKVFYTENDYRDFLTRRGWVCLREFDGYRNIDNLDDLRPGAIYRGVS